MRALVRPHPACYFLHRKRQEPPAMSVIATPNERCRWLEMAQQLRRSCKVLREAGEASRRGSNSRRISAKSPVSRLPQLWGHSSPPKRLM